MYTGEVKLVCSKRKSFTDRHSGRIYIHFCKLVEFLLCCFKI